MKELQRREFLAVPVAAAIAGELTMTSPVTAATADTNNDRYKRGWAKLAEVDGEAGQNVIDSLRDIAPDLGRYIIEYAFGDLYSRPGLDLRSREIATVAALTVMGTAAPQLKVHIHAALNVGVTQEEIIEIILQMSAYAGFPASLNAIQVAKDVFGDAVGGAR